MDSSYNRLCAGKTAALAKHPQRPWAQPKLCDVIHQPLELGQKQCDGEGVVDMAGPVIMAAAAEPRAMSAAWTHLFASASFRLCSIRCFCSSDAPLFVWRRWGGEKEMRA